MMDRIVSADAERFIRANTAILAPPHVPEIRLHLADEAHDLWLKTEAELDAIGLPPPFWAFAWAGGQALARLVLDHPEIVRGKHVADFATGSGLVAIAAARAGASSVTGYDIDPFCAAAIRLNTALNETPVGFEARDIIGEIPQADILLAGDVFFDADMARRIAPWFDRPLPPEMYSNHWIARFHAWKPAELQPRLSGHGATVTTAAAS